MMGLSGTFQGNLPNLSKSSGLENHFPFNAGHQMRLIPSYTLILVGALEHVFHFSHHIGHVIIPTVTHSIVNFRGVG